MQLLFMPEQNALILKFLLTKDETSETQNIFEQLQLYDFNVDMSNIENGDRLKEVLQTDKKYDFTYD